LTTVPSSKTTAVVLLMLGRLSDAERVAPARRSSGAVHDPRQIEAGCREIVRFRHTSALEQKHQFDSAIEVSRKRVA